MGSIGISEFLFIAILVTLLFGPGQLPDLLRKIRGFSRDFHDFRRESELTNRKIEAEVLDIEKETKDAKTGGGDPGESPPRNGGATSP